MGQKNLKTFNRADICNFLYYIKGISEKTWHNYISCLRDFFRNLVDDEIIEVTQAPRMPKVPYNLEYRKITDIETQNAVLNKVKELTYHFNPKIWLGYDMLSLYMPFFRHTAGIPGVSTEVPFGEKYFYKWWIRACEQLGIKGLDLYGGTRHTTTSALAKQVGESGAKKATGHDTNKAFERYCQYQDDDTFEMVRIAAIIKGKVIEFKKKNTRKR